MTDQFDRHYTLGVLDDLQKPTSIRAVEERRTRVKRGRVATRAAPAAAFALKGCVIAPDRELDPGFVVVDGQQIALVRETEPAGVPVTDTGGVILPGLIDLHGHPEFNVFAAWEPPRLYINRWTWRESEEYRTVVRRPCNRLIRAPFKLLREMTRYAEVRALVGGVTAIQGATARYPDRSEALVRNVDLPIFGQHRAVSIVDIDFVEPAKRLELRQRLDNHEITALYIHVAEGRADNATARKEFDEVANAGFLRAETVVIHGTALDDQQMGRLHEVGGKIVWSPQSNLRLYGETTNVAKAISLGIPLGLGADWLPSGSASLLAEMKVARERLVLQKVPLTEPQLWRKLVRMVTADAAAIAGLSDSLGKLESGRPADIIVLRRAFEDPYRSVVEAEPADVELVVIGGFLAYGRADWMDEIAPCPDAEQVIAWGKNMKLDTSYVASPTGEPPIRLKSLRSRLLAGYPQTGPIFA